MTLAIDVDDHDGDAGAEAAPERPTAGEAPTSRMWREYRPGHPK
ncbi:hypothetical protein [Micromonospora coxensis]|nr:hypothetical protein [Micromonospora coxensis]